MSEEREPYGHKQGVRPRFPKGCTIRDIERGEGDRSHVVYACLYGPDGLLMISADLEYINEQIRQAGTEQHP